jgi:formate dehydrogenase maturation protein FdhE
MDNKDNSKCPSCGSPHLDGGFVEICGMEAVQAVSCTACDSSWEEVYTFSRRQNMEQGG